MSNPALGRPLGRVLVTGASGFLGRAVLDALVADGYDAIGADRDVSRGRPGTERLDLTVPYEVDAFLDRVRPESILHFAAFGADAAGLLASAQGHPRTAVAVNVEGFAGLLQAAARHGVGRVVWSSSTTVYGPPAMYAPKARVTEADPPAPTTIYGATKMIAERYTMLVLERGDLSVTGLRLPLVYGPGRWYGGAQATWMAFASDVAHGRAGAYAFSAAEEDWIYIDDAVDAVLAAGRAATDLAPVYNVAGTTTSPYAAARALIRRRNADVTVTGEPRERAIVLVDGAAFAATTGFAPRVDVDDGVERFTRAVETEASPT
ncbi:MAG: NAD-dependent epimerase/dehydratase family protein [Trueperaceae bacterium]|nr:NAD-dependent epimerase/dehydratase family protein [Trueperaceae bacterium]